MSSKFPPPKALKSGKNISRRKQTNDIGSVVDGGSSVAVPTCSFDTVGF
jgi:hypothetical protein